MKVLIVLMAAVCVAVAKPGYVPGAYGVLPQPVQDTPEVSAAKAAHFAAHAHAAAAAAVAPVHAGYAAPVHAGYAGYAANALAYAAPGAYGLGYHGYHAAPVALTPHGVPVDTPEVQAARAANAAAHAAAKQQHLYG